MEKGLFPVGIGFNMFSTTLLIAVFAFAGRGEIASEVAVVQGASMVLFLAFSANIRNLLLSNNCQIFTRNTLLFRFAMMLPLAAGVVLLSTSFVTISPVMAIAILIRRCSEWIAEIQITEREISEDIYFIKRFIAIQAILLGALFVSILVGNVRITEILLVIWAVSPFSQIVPFLRRVLATKESFSFDPDLMLPHVGSSMVIGVTVYVFRLMIIALVGKMTGGALLAAYSVGGICVSFYVHGIGPSLVRWRQNLRVSHRVSASIILGLCVLGTIALVSGMLITDTYYHDLLFASGVSLIGGGIMIAAQHRRLGLLHASGREVYVADTLSNIILICTIPFIFYLFGRESLNYVYAWSALLSVGAYFVLLANKSDDGMVSHWRSKLGGYAKVWIGVALLFPLFFQLSGEIFMAQEMVFDSGGKLFRVPLPISVIACVIGLVLLIRSERSVLTVNYIFFSFALMVFTTLGLSAQNGEAVNLGKMILLVQFILPMFALILGVSWVGHGHAGLKEISIEKIFLYVVFLIVLVQLIATYYQGRSPLTSYLYLFSVYQHLQYVSLIMVGVFWWASIACFENRNERWIIMIFAPLIGLYSFESISFQVVGIAIIGAVAMPILRGFSWRAVLVSMLVVGGLIIGFVSDQELSSFGAGTQSDVVRQMKWHNKYYNDEEPLPQEEVAGWVPIAVKSRVYAWQYHWKGIIENASSFLFGHLNRPNRSEMPSSHNYLLDLIYNFGFLSAIPSFYLITLTIRRIVVGRVKWRSHPGLLALVGLVLLLVLVGNSLSVGLRQPYAGIFTFFIWGLLLGRLELSDISDVNMESDQVRQG